jgi:hypothetical protein
MTIQEKLHIMQLIERLESTKAIISISSTLRGGTYLTHVSIHEDINGVPIFDEDNNKTCNMFYGYRAAVDELETMIRQAGAK